MMCAEEFYQIFEKFTPLLGEYGLKKKARNRYLFRNNVRMQVILNKWGWTDDVGNGFLIRLSDMERLPDNLNPELIVDITPYRIGKEKGVTAESIKQVYASVPREVYQYYLDGMWFQYYDTAQLEKLLTVILPAALDLAHEYSVAQVKKRQLPIIKPQPISKDKMTEIEVKLDRAFKKDISQ